MELDSIECVSSIDGMDEDEIHHYNLHHQNLHHGNRQFSLSKPHNGTTNNTISANTINNNGGPTAIAPATSVHELLECPVCTNSMYPPIHQCHNGHTLCSTCKTKVHNRCPICRQELGDIRCLALEKVAESLELPCKYYNLGCPEIFPSYSKLRHEVFHCFGHYFCLHFDAFHLAMAPVYMAFLLFMGDEMEARHYSYSLEVGGNGRKLIWEVPHVASVIVTGKSGTAMMV